MADWLKGRSVYPALRRALNLIFTVIITSFFFERWFFKYEWLSFSDYKAILNFLVKGQFIAPLALFLLVYGMTQFISFILFNSLTFFQKIKYQRKIIYHELHREELVEGINSIRNIAKLFMPYNLTEEELTQFYYKLRPLISEDLIEKFRQELLIPKEEMYKDFSFGLRILILLIIAAYMHSLGIIMLSVSILGIVTYMFLLTLAHRILSILPFVINRLTQEADLYLKQSPESKTIKKINESNSSSI